MHLARASLNLRFAFDIATCPALHSYQVLSKTTWWYTLANLRYSICDISLFRISHTTIHHTRGMNLNICFRTRLVFVDLYRRQSLASRRISYPLRVPEEHDKSSTWTCNWMWCLIALKTDAQSTSKVGFDDNIKDFFGPTRGRSVIPFVFLSRAHVSHFHAQCTSLSLLSFTNALKRRIAGILIETRRMCASVELCGSETVQWGMLIIDSYG